MSISVTLAGIDITSQIDRRSLEVQQIIGAQRDTARMIYKKFGSRSYVPAALDTVLIRDGSTSIFGGRITNITQLNLNNADGIVYQLDCADYSIDLDSELVSAIYQDMMIGDIIADILTNFATGFTGTNVNCGFTVTKIVFNHIPISQALKQLADLVQYSWYVDPAKDVHFFPKYTEIAPFNLTDASGNYVNGSLRTVSDSTQLANQVKVRGGTYLSSTAFSDSITVKGSASKSFKLPYQFNSLTITVNGVSKTVGVDFIDDPASHDVLYNFQQWTIVFPSPLADGDVIAFSGTPYIPVLAVATDAASIALYGTREKLVEDKSINDIDTARQRAIMELAAYKNPLGEAYFDTYTAGLYVGQVININSSRRNIDTDYIIRRITFRPRTPTDFIYAVECVTVRAFTLIDLLQKLLLPEVIPLDPNEVNEIIKTDLTTIAITETIALHSSPDHTDIATVTIAEVVAHDPLGSGVAPTWVLGPYIPASTSDTKRVINLDHNSAVLY